jgi:hypothetical protein
MALVVKDRVKETTTTTGTGTVTLAGASTGYQSFSAIGNGNTTYYTISNPGTNEWEVGIGTYTSSGTTLSRDTVLASSNSGSAVSFSAGTKDVFVVYPAGKAIYLDASGNSVALGTPASTTTLTNCTGLPISTGVSGLGTNVATALAINTGSAGAFVVNGGALGTPSSGTLTSCTGLPISTGVSGLGTGVATALGNNVNTTGGTVTQSGTLAASALLIGGGSATAITSTTTGTGVVTALGVNTGSAGAFVVNGGALGTPSSGTLTSCTGLPISTGVSGLGTGVATFLATPTSANLASAVTDETGSGLLVFGTSPTMSNITLSAGTASLAPVVMTSGTNLSSVAAGALEYDGVAFYTTGNTTSGRGFTPTTQYFRLTSDGSAIGTSITNFFGATSSLNLIANGFYELEAVLYFLKTTAGTVTFTMTFGNAPVNNNAYYVGTPISGVGTQGTPQSAGLVKSTATAGALPATGSLSNGANHQFTIRAMFQANATTGGTLTLQLTSTATSATPLTGSYYKLTRLPAANTGAFA